MNSFETVYRKARKSHIGRELYFAFCRRTSELMGDKWTREDHGCAVWVWEQNERKARHEGKKTVKGLCFGDYYSHAGRDGFDG